MSTKFIAITLLLISITAIKGQWVEMYTGLDLNIITISAVNDNTVWVCGNPNRKVLRTTNGGANWIDASGSGISPSITLNTIFALDNQTAFVSGHSGNSDAGSDPTYIYKTTNGGINWIESYEEDDTFFNSIFMKNFNEGIAIGDPRSNASNHYSLRKTSNGGASWYAAGSVVGQSGEAAKINSLCVIGDNVWFGSNASKIYYSSNFGTTWAVQNLTGFTQGVTYIHFINSTTGICGGFGTLAMTTNGGSNWNAITYPGGGYVVGIGGSGSNWVISKYGYSVYYSTNNGSNWSVEYQVPDSSIRNHMTTSRTGSYMWDCRTKGKVGKRLGPVAVTQIGSDIPTRFRLLQNYPNPFNPETKIRFDISKHSHINMNVYDIQGQQVSSIFEGELAAGTYEYSFNARDLPSGIYFYKLETENFSEVRKMILVK